MNVQLLTLFPELFDAFFQLGLMSRAVEQKIISHSVTHLRDYAINSQGQVDDTPYGGGSGMVLRPEPAVQAIEEAKARVPKAKVVVPSPRGLPLTQSLAREFAKNLQDPEGGLIILCSRYEGVDERVLEHWVDREVSIGDVVLMGGEVAAMALLESSVRLLPGVLGNPDSLKEESFSQNLLEYPQYTKPSVYRELSVPEILLSGHHKNIEDWRKEQAIRVTQERRPDLLPAKKERKSKVHLALVHYPVVDKHNTLITSSITNIDLHDIARSSRTYGMDSLYIVHPAKTLRRLMSRICEHWDKGYGSTYNPNRKDALQLLRLVPSFQDVLLDIEARTGKPPQIVTTSAQPPKDSVISFQQLRPHLYQSEESFLLVFGTGWGLAPEVHEQADWILEPIVGAGDYNHLSVRAAAAIILDKLFGSAASPDTASSRSSEPKHTHPDS